MTFDVQRAGIWKRISAWMFDRILLSILAVGMMWLLSLVTGYDSIGNRYSDGLVSYEKAYNMSFAVTNDEYQQMSDADRQNWDAAYQALISDTEVMAAYSTYFRLTIMNISLSIFIAYLALEFLVPVLAFGHGRTLGKRVFGLAVMRTEGVRISGPVFFVRAILGKYTLETMVPVFIILMIYFNQLGIIGLVVLGAYAVLQIILLFATANHSPVHDLLSDTIVVDYASQKIYNSREEMIADINADAKESAARDPY